MLFELDAVVLFNGAQLQEIVITVNLVGLDAAFAGQIPQSHTLGELVPKGVIVIIEDIFVIKALGPFGLHKVLTGFSVDINVRQLVDREQFLHNRSSRLVLEIRIMLSVHHPLAQIGKLNQFSKFFSCEFKFYHWIILAEVEESGDPLITLDLYYLIFCSIITYSFL